MRLCFGLAKALEHGERVFLSGFRQVSRSDDLFDMGQVAMLLLFAALNGKLGCRDAHCDGFLNTKRGTQTEAAEGMIRRGSNRLQRQPERRQSCRH